MKVDVQGRAYGTRLSRTTTAVLREEEDLSTWSDEELLRGRRKDKKGNFTGKPPKIVPMELVRELVKRRYSRSFAVLGNGLEEAARRVVAITKKKEPTQGDLIALKACEVLFNRVLGKPTERLIADITAEHKPWMSLVAESIVGIVGNEQQQRELESDVVEGEILDDTLWYQEDEEPASVTDAPPPDDSWRDRGPTTIEVGDATAGKPPRRR